MYFVHVLQDSGDPRSVNGVNKVVHSLATAQVEMGHRVEVWSITQDGSPATHERKYLLKAFKATKLRFSLDTVLEEAVDALPQGVWVQLHSVYVPELASVARRVHRRSIPYGVTTHGGYLSLYFDNPLRRARKAIFSMLWENWMLRHASMIHMIGATEYEDLLRRAPHTKIVLIPNGYSPDPALLEQYGVRQEADPPSIVFCGRHVIKQKGLHLLMRGFAEYQKRGGTLRLIMVSSGPDTAYLQSLASELGVADAITWPGILPVDELRKTVRGAAVFVHTSQFDVLPTSCLEAAALEVPLLVSHETNFAEYLLPRHAGWMPTRNIPADIAETMFEIQATSPEERMAIGKNARRMIDEELRWDNISVKLTDTVRECMEPVKTAVHERSLRVRMSTHR